MQSCLPNDSRQLHPILRQLHDKDAVVTEIEGLLLPEEAEYLVRTAGHVGFEDSTVMRDGRPVKDTQRTSRTAFLPKSKDDVVDCIGARISTVVGQSSRFMEPMQVTDYTHKQQYSAHHDYFNRPNEPERTTTLFAYLHEEKCSTGLCGGSTTFHNLTQANGEPLRVYPKVGNAVMWSNRTSDGGLNAETLHSGEKLTCDGARKIGLNAWFRDKVWG